MEQGSGLVESGVDPGGSPLAAPVFLVELPPWRKVFFHNLGDLFWPRRQPCLELSSPPGRFWPDVFVRSGLPRNGFLESALYHVTAFAMLSAFAQFWPRPPHIADRATFNHADVIYYQASEYLPPLDTSGAHIPLPQQGEPEYAPQPIISVPPEPDNRTQTIVTPPNLKLNHDVPLPNIVAWSQRQVEVPLAATARSAADLKMPALPVPVVAPPPQVNPAALVHSLRAPQPAIIEPPPSLEAASIRKLGDINVGHTEVVAPAPQLPVTAQRALAGMARPSLDSAGAVVPPPPSIQGAGPSNTGGRLIALGIHPAVLSTPIEVPAGNRRGIFAATPEGKPGAPGTPDTSPDGNRGSGNGAGSGNSTNGIPPGLFVGAGPQPADHSAVTAHGNAAAGGSSRSQPFGNPRLMADAVPPRVTSIPRRPTGEVSGDNATALEKKVFGDRKFYSMTLNMPNLNSAGGSWVIRFAELTESDDKGELVAPVATQKVDPAYPLELMHHNVQGTVTLYAVIRSDGSVGDVRVLRGVDDRLDEYARAALSGWHFRPATKNGNAVDLKAVVVIPFRLIRMKSSF
ncbi:MAG TPA: TonB family protein [Terriglobales bacterium]|nr:TonB family protein [Terriglobales bacterium]